MNSARIVTFLLAAAPVAPLARAAPPSPAAQAFATFEAGEAAFRAGDFPRAARLFAEAFVLHPEPAYLFNEALALAKAERFPSAIAALERLLREFPANPRRADVEARLAEFRASRQARRARIAVTSLPAGATAVVVGEDASCVAPCELWVDPGEVTVRVGEVPTDATASRKLAPGETWSLRVTGESPPPLEPDRTSAWIAIAAGGAAVLTGVGFGVAAGDAWATAKNLADASPLDDSDYSRFEDARRDASTFSTAADVSFALAGAGAAIATVLWLAADADPEAGPGGFTWRF